MNSDVQLSKRLSYHLRHAPQELGLTLQPGGWVGVDDLLAALRAVGLTVTRADLERTVAGSDKQRFALSADGARIRANQGHSVPVDLGLEPRDAPAVLYHGTVGSSLDLIRREGLKPMGRHHVHLSPDRETAHRVGQRRGAPVILKVDAARMQRAGHAFFVSENGVWLTDHVPPEFLSDE